MSRTLGRGTARGMAPKARLAVYKVQWNGQIADSDTSWPSTKVWRMVSMCFRSHSSPPFDANNAASRPKLWKDMVAIASYGAMKKGVFVSLAAGNDGPVPNSPTGAVSNVSPWMTTVGAATMDRSFAAQIVLGNGSMVINGESLYTKGVGVNGSAPLIYARYAATDALVAANNTAAAALCVPGSLNASLVMGKIVLCYSSADGPLPEVESSGAVGVIVSMIPELGEDVEIYPVHVLPTIKVGAAEGSAIVTYIASTPAPVAQFRLPATTQYTRSPAPAVAAFSSRGPSQAYPLNIIKPDLVAPGVDIIGAGIKDLIWNLDSGTSMATPHVAGLAALLKAAHPTWSPAAIRSALMTTATITDRRNETITVSENGRTGTPFDFGSGFVQPERAADPGLVYDLTPDDYFQYLCMLEYPPEIIRSFDADAPACPATPIRVADFNYPSFLVTVLNTPDEISTNATRTVTNVGPANSTYVAYFYPVMAPGSAVPANITISAHPPSLTFTDLNEKLSFTLVVSLTGLVADPVFSSYIIWSDGTGHFVQSPIVIGNGAFLGGL